MTAGVTALALGEGAPVDGVGVSVVAEGDGWAEEAEGVGDVCRLSDGPSLPLHAVVTSVNSASERARRRVT